MRDSFTECPSQRTHERVLGTCLAFHAIENTFDLENTLVRGGVDNTIVKGVENTFYLCNR